MVTIQVQRPRPTIRHCHTTLGQNTHSCCSSRQILTSPWNSVLCLMRTVHARFLSDTTHCLMVTSKSVIGQCQRVHRGLQHTLSQLLGLLCAFRKGCSILNVRLFFFFLFFFFRGERGRGEEGGFTRLLLCLLCRKRVLPNCVQTRFASLSVVVCVYVCLS